MDNEQITALAREYAESKIKEPGLIHKDSMLFGAIVANAETCLEWLLRRYALVEKSQVEQIYKEAAEGKCELEKMQPQNTYAKNSIAMRIGEYYGCVYTLKSLFPDLGKEVE